MSSIVTSIQATIASFGIYVAHLWNLAIYSGFPLIFWVQPRWSVDEITDQSGKVILITGANSGTGFASAWALYEAGAKVYLACRSEAKANDAIAFIKSHRWKGKTGKVTGELVFLQLDLSDLKSVKRAADEFNRSEGLYTAQEYTLQFGTNVLGHQALIHHLLPVLLSSSARVLLLSSAGHAAAPRGGVDYRSVVRDPADPNDPKNPVKGRYEVAKWAEYGQAKWGDIALARYLHAVYGPGSTLSSRRTGQGELLCFSMHPGMVATNLSGHLSVTGFITKHLPFLYPVLTRHPDVGAGNQLWLASMPTAQAKKLAGGYIVPFQRIGRPRPDVLAEANVVRMWDWCEEQVKKHAE